MKLIEVLEKATTGQWYTKCFKFIFADGKEIARTLSYDPESNSNSLPHKVNAALIVHCTNKYPNALDRVLHITSKLQNLIALCGLDPDDFKDIIDPLVEVWEEGQEVKGI